MQFSPTDLPEVIVVDPDVYRDARGFFLETYRSEPYRRGGIDGTFVQDNHSRSSARTLRGLHLQLGLPQGKLVRAIVGTIFDVAVDVRRGSPTFGRWVGVTLSAENFRQCYIPPGFAHGFCVESDVAEVEYKCTAVYDKAREIGVAWNSPELGIQWPVDSPLLSERDAHLPTLTEALDMLPRWTGERLAPGDPLPAGVDRIAFLIMRVMVTGAAGQLGSALVQRCAGHTVVALTRVDLDIADEAAVRGAVERARPDAIVNCAAYNDVDGAERDATSALLGNSFGVLHLARAARAAGALFIHYSTDFVFDGAADRPYVESDPPAPLSTYGNSKLLGEWFAADAPDAYVLRVESLFGGPRAKSSVDRILATIQAGQPTRVFGDRTVTPSFVEDVVTVTESLLNRQAAPGLYHCVNSGTTTWLGIATEAARLLGADAEIVSVNLADVKMTARRPLYCALSNEKLRDAGLVMPTWQDALRRHVGSVAERQS